MKTGKGIEKEFGDCRGAGRELGAAGQRGWAQHLKSPCPATHCVRCPCDWLVTCLSSPSLPLSLSLSHTHTHTHTHTPDEGRL